MEKNRTVIYMLPKIKPMEPVSTDCLYEGDGWIYQIKWDGVRILANIEPDRVQLYTRKGNDRTYIYPEITKELQNAFKNTAFIFDGEIIALENGQPHFFQVMKRDRLKNGVKIQQAITHLPVYYVVFDILYKNGCSLTNEPLTYRLKILDKLKKRVKSPHIQFCPSFDDGQLLYDFTKENGFEGIVMKENDGQYYIGKRSSTWKKLKHFQEIQANIIGIELQNGRAHSVLLALQEEGTYRYAGKAGLPQSDLRLLMEHSERLLAEVPVIHLPSYQDKQVIWIKPLLSVKVQFLEFTPQGQLRSPVIKGFM